MLATKKRKFSGFTIVELLVVIVVIGILAAITIVSYTGISQKATAASLQSDLSNSAKKLKMYQVEYGSYPTMGTPDSNGMTCPTAPNTDTKYCIKPSSGNTFTYSSLSPYATFSLTNTNSNTMYNTTNDSGPVVIPTVTIGTQTWMRYNLNVGTMVTGVTVQTNNATLEKYCYDNTESKCTTYGALYQWDEAMQYVTTEGAQGICPAGSHIPSDNDWKILEMKLGMTQEQTDAYGWRGTDQGTQLKSGGTSGLNLPLAGHRDIDGSFGGLLTYSYLSSSSKDIWGSSTWKRLLFSDGAPVMRDTPNKAEGMSVRCLRN